MVNSTFTNKELTQWNTLKYACTNDPDSFKILLYAISASVINGVVDKDNLLFIACRTQSESVKHLLECERFTDESINAVNEFGQTAIFVACNTQSQAVKYLLECERFTDTSINKTETSGGVTVLHRACIYNVESVQHLLKSERFTDQSINATDNDGQTALHTACMSLNDSIKHLLDCDRFYESSVNAITNKRNTALHFVCQKCNIKFIELLLSSNKLITPMVNIINTNGMTAIDLARKHQSTATVQALINYVRELNDHEIQNYVPNPKLSITQLQIENTELKQTIAQLELKLCGQLEPLH